MESHQEEMANFLSKIKKLNAISYDSMQKYRFVVVQSSTATNICFASITSVTDKPSLVHV